MNYSFALSILVGAFAAGHSDWPQFLGPNADGMSPEKGINKNWNAKPPSLVWKTNLGDGGYTAPAVAKGVVYIVDHEKNTDVVKALDLKTGVEKWRYLYEEPVDDSFGFARSTPTVKDGKVFTLSRMGRLNCLDATTGASVWTRDIVGEFKGQRPKWDIAASPVVDGNRLLVCPGGENAAVVALDKNTGKTIWEGGGSGVTGYSTPVSAKINGKRQYVMFLFASIEGIDAETGRVIWSFPWSDWSGVSASRPVVVGNSVFVTSGYARGCVLLDIEGANAKPRWDNKVIESEFSSPILVGGYLYCTSAPGNLVCVEVATGTMKWKQPGFEKGGLVGVDGVLIVMNGSNGDLTMVRVDPTGYQELGKMSGLGGQSWTAPIIADGKLIIRNRKTLACYDLR